jgi:hypothetical protein
MLAPPAQIAVALRRIAGEAVTGEARIVAAQTVISFANLFEAAFAAIRNATARADPQTRIQLLHRLAEQGAEHAAALAPYQAAAVSTLAAQWRTLAAQIAAIATPEAVPSRPVVEFELHRARREWKDLRVLAEQVQGSRPVVQDGGDFR